MPRKQEIGKLEKGKIGTEKPDIREEKEFEPLSVGDLWDLNNFKQKIGIYNFEEFLKEGQPYLEKNFSKQRADGLMNDLKSVGMSLERLRKLNQRRKQELKKIGGPWHFLFEYRDNLEEYDADLKHYIEEFSRLDPEEQKRRVLREAELLNEYLEGDKLRNLSYRKNDRACQRIMDAIVENMVEEKKRAGIFSGHSVAFQADTAEKVAELKDPSYENIALDYLERSFHPLGAVLWEHEPKARIKEIVEIFQEESRKEKEEEEGLSDARRKSKEAFGEEGEKE